MQVERARFWALGAALTALWGAVPLEAQTGSGLDVAGELKWRVEELRVRGAVQIGDAVVPARELTLAVYEQRGFLPLWTSPLAVRSLLEAIAAGREDGLDPELYHLTRLTEAARGAWDASSVAERDLLATDAFARLSHDKRLGRVEPYGPASDGDAEWVFGGPDAVANLTRVVASRRVREALADLRPRHFVYVGLLRALAELRRIEGDGGWGAVPPGPTLARDSVDLRVISLRRRLVLSGDLRRDADPLSVRYDSVLEAAVRAFQHRHGLNEDGAVGSATLAALNVPVERRIEQVRVNLERARWVAHEFPDTFVTVNVAGARVYLLHGDTVVFETRAIVGTNFSRTPVFTAAMLYVDLNPTWTVPPGIVQEVLDAVRHDPGYLKGQGMRVLDPSGYEVDPAAIDFSRYTAADFPYLFRQDAGPANALGRIKLMLPNPYSVYLHDTPTRGLFAKEVRLFSHGCVRIEDAVGLAELVLGDTARWNRATLQEAIDTGITRTIRLARPVPVFVLYWTAAVDLDGTLHFYRDVYDRDARVLAGLDALPGRGTLGGGGR
jgi:murein L,D-transpeptidase YcbB/YkuD